MTRAMAGRSSATALRLVGSDILPMTRAERLRRPAPRLRRLLPSTGRAGDNLFLEGDHLDGADLRVDFGMTSTWAVALDDRTAFCIVPPGAGSTVAVSRFGLRSNTLAFGGAWDDEPMRVVRVDPADGLTGVFRDTPILVRLSRAADAGSLTLQSFRVEDAGGLVPGHARLSPDGYVIIWQGSRLLEAGVEHRLLIAGLRDRRGREIASFRSRFAPCTLIRAELP